MARIRGADTSPERLLRRALWAAGVRFRVQVRVEGCRPDVCFPRQRVVVFVDGCFWHGCPRHYARPSARAGYWADKLARNVARDAAQTRALERAGWRVVRVWEHDVCGVPGRAPAPIDAVVSRVLDALREPCWLAEDDWRVVAVYPAEDGRERWCLRCLRDASAAREEIRTGSRVTRPTP